MPAASSAPVAGSGTWKDPCSGRYIWPLTSAVKLGSAPPPTAAAMMSDRSPPLPSSKIAAEPMSSAK